MCLNENGSRNIAERPSKQEVVWFKCGVVFVVASHVGEGTRVDKTFGFTDDRGKDIWGEFCGTEVQEKRERLVQCVKRALLLNLGSAKLTPDVFATIVSEAECLVNSRPLTHVRSNHEDDNPLTPNHFLLGRPFCNVPGAVFNETHTSKSSAWTQMKQRLQQIWKRLLTEFVPSLNKRQKWTSREAALEVDDNVWLLEELTPRGIWPLGRVTRTFTGPDNIARSCEVKTALDKLNRPAVKLIHVYPKPTSRLGLGCVGPEEVMPHINFDDFTAIVRLILMTL